MRVVSISHFLSHIEGIFVVFPLELEDFFHPFVDDNFGQETPSLRLIAVNGLSSCLHLDVLIEKQNNIIRSKGLRFVRLADTSGQEVVIGGQNLPRPDRVRMQLIVAILDFQDEGIFPFVLSHVLFKAVPQVAILPGHLADSNVLLAEEEHLLVINFLDAGDILFEDQLYFLLVALVAEFGVEFEDAARARIEVAVGASMDREVIGVCGVEARAKRADVRHWQVILARQYFIVWASHGVKFLLLEGNFRLVAHHRIIVGQKQGQLGCGAEHGPLHFIQDVVELFIKFLLPVDRLGSVLEDELDFADQEGPLGADEHVVDEAVVEGSGEPVFDADHFDDIVVLQLLHFLEYFDDL